MMNRYALPCHILCRAIDVAVSVKRSLQRRDIRHRFHR